MNESEIFNDTERSLNWIKWQKTVEMKRNCIIIFIALMAATVLASIPTRYYVGKIEVPESFWNKMPDSIDYISSEFNYDTLIVKNRELTFTHYIDTVSIPGNYVLSMRPQEVVAELEHAFSVVNRNHRKKSLLVSVVALRETDAAAVDDIYGGNDFYHSSRKFFNLCSPTSPLFSGWNCVP